MYNQGGNNSVIVVRVSDRCSSSSCDVLGVSRERVGLEDTPQ